MPVYGAEVKLKPGERAVATRLTRKQRRDVCELVGVSEKRFHNAVTGWVKLRLAHLCGKGVVTLFISPLGGDAAICPSCRGSLASSPATGTDLPAVRETPSRSTGRTAAGIAASTSASERDALKVIQQGEGEGGSDDRTPLQELLEPDEEAFQKARRLTEAMKKEAAS